MRTKSEFKWHWQMARTRERLELIRQNLDKSDTAIGQMFGVCRQAVHHLRMRYKIAKPHVGIARRQRRIEQVRRLKPGFSVRDVAAQFGLSVDMARQYGKLAGYQFLRVPAARHFHWQKQMKSLPPLLTVSDVARRLGLSYGYAALLCARYKYMAKLRTGRNKQRVPIRHWLRRPQHEQWLASLKPMKS